MISYYRSFNVYSAAPRLSIIPGHHADTASEACGTAALAFDLTVFRGLLFLCLFPFPDQEFLGHAAVDEVPRQEFFDGALPVGIKFRSQPTFLHGVKPSVIVVVLAPGIEKTALLIDL